MCHLSCKWCRFLKACHGDLKLTPLAYAVKNLLPYFCCQSCNVVVWRWSCKYTFQGCSGIQGKIMSYRREMLFISFMNRLQYEKKNVDFVISTIQNLKRQFCYIYCLKKYYFDNQKFSLVVVLMIIMCLWDPRKSHRALHWSARFNDCNDKRPMNPVRLDVHYCR